MNWLLLLALMPATAQAQPGLWALEKVIALKYPVQEIRSDSLAIRIAENDSTLLLFDTRKPEEYAVSRLRDAIRIDPEMDVEGFFATYGDTLKDKNLVFYCSVGYRSSIFAQRIQKNASSPTYSSIANLRGGLFRWYNEDRPLFRDTQVDTVHPYDKHWGRFLKKKK
ncbi:MAG: rhodanese-related sulfurtransferase [Candidatus Latescibacterota bacterium]|jgi:rhodanese-related sulfurtransferase